MNYEKIYKYIQKIKIILLIIFSVLLITMILKEIWYFGTSEIENYSTT